MRKQNTHLVELMQQVKLIIWDEAPMTQRYAFEALDKTLRDILGYKYPEKRNHIFGGMKVFLEELWKCCKVFTLTRSMRVNEYSGNREIDLRKQNFNRWVLAVGDGKLPAKKKETEDEPTWIEILEEFLIKSWSNPMEQIVLETYPDFTTRKTDKLYLKERAILTPINDDADAINEFMFKKLGGVSMTYNSVDEICKASTDTEDQHHLYPVEFLNTLNFPGMPPHALCLKRELPVMLIRNVSDISKRTKTKPNWTKPSMGLEEREKNEAEGCTCNGVDMVLEKDFAGFGALRDDVNPLFDEVIEDIESKDSYVSKLNEPALLVTPLSDANKDECFDPGVDFDEIDAFLDIDVPT
ncbi:ATP-dependent DNA helicase PIF1-like protein [Tanacetum coccineum]